MKKIICPNCDEVIMVDSNKKYVDCPFCNYEFKAVEAEEVKEPIEKNKSKKKAKDDFNKLFE